MMPIWCEDGGSLMADGGWRMADDGCWVLDVGCWMLDVVAWSALSSPTFILRTSHGRSLRVTFVVHRAAMLGASESVVVTGTRSKCLSCETPLREFGGKWFSFHGTSSMASGVWTDSQPSDAARRRPKRCWNIWFPRPEGCGERMRCVPRCMRTGMRAWGRNERGRECVCAPSRRRVCANPSAASATHRCAAAPVPRPDSVAPSRSGRRPASPTHISAGPAR